MQDAKRGNNRAVTAGQCLGPERHDGELLAKTPAELRGCWNVSRRHSRCARSMTRRAKPIKWVAHRRGRISFWSVTGGRWVHDGYGAGACTTF